MLKNKNAITLIALVVTIVVLLILAGVSISLILDNNGIIAKSKDARLKSRTAQVEDEVGLWKQQNFINKESNQKQEEADAILESLISRNLLKEDEIDREQEIITIKKSDGSILKQISYSPVTINISKSPESKNAGSVVLKVDSVDGITMPTITNKAEIDEYIASLGETEKKEIIKNGYIKLINKQDPTANCTTFEEALEWEKNTQGQEITEADFWTMIDTGEGGIDGALSSVLKEAFGNEETETIEVYTVTNPDNEISNIYVAAENGTYTFKIKDIVTGKVYTKKVTVDNIDPEYEVYNVTERTIGLRNKETKEPTTFSNLYYVNMEPVLTEDYDRIEISEDGTYNYAVKASGYIKLVEKGGTVIFIEKDGKLYPARVEIFVTVLSTL